ncbi:MAG: WecB/TagA/CpsF family glycosyltransferase, partial [Sediminibacterium sp.]|nr:WecB/TagA/CpsF family glycosyltransferase [Sediminibacterium sp.]
MVQILGVPFFSNNLQAAVQHVINSCEAGNLPKNYCISASGAHGLVEASKNPSFKSTLNQFYLNLPDGMPAVWVGRLKGAKEMRRCYGPDFFMEIMKASASLPIKHFLCGGKEGVANMLKDNCAQRFGNTNVVGTYCPPFRTMTDAEMEELANTITQSKANMVWIGMSCPKQELFAFRLAKFTKTHFIVAVGAAFDFHTDQVKQAPKW